jgi:hypothetical protein
MNDKVQTQQQSPGARRKPGPRTPHGKEHSKYNAVKTGIFAKIVLTGKPFAERRGDFDELLANLRESIGPRDQFEEILVESLSLEFLKLARTYQADAEVAPLMFQNVREKFQSNGEEQAIAGLLNESSPTDQKLPAADLLLRYESGIWRQIDRLIERVEHWRRLHDSSAQTGWPKSGGE